MKCCEWEKLMKLWPPTPLLRLPTNVYDKIGIWRKNRAHEKEIGFYEITPHPPPHPICDFFSKLHFPWIGNFRWKVRPAPLVKAFQSKGASSNIRQKACHGCQAKLDKNIRFLTWQTMWKCSLMLLSILIAVIVRFCYSPLSKVSKLLKELTKTTIKSLQDL